jgi:hypothetical protein
MADDFLDLISQVTSYVQNERNASYNEGVDETLRAVRGWMLLEGVRITDQPPRPHEGIPDLLNEIKEHFLAIEEANDKPTPSIVEGAELLNRMYKNASPVKTFTGGG